MIITWIVLIVLVGMILFLSSLILGHTPRIPEILGKIIGWMMTIVGGSMFFYKAYNFQFQSWTTDPYLIYLIASNIMTLVYSALAFCTGAVLLKFKGTKIYYAIMVILGMTTVIYALWNLYGAFQIQ